MRVLRCDLVVGVIIASAMTGCGPQTLSYVPKDITALPNLDPVAVYLFVDTRGKEERRIGTRFFQGRVMRKADPIYVSEPVAVAVTRAFADGLKARGFRVVDLTRTPFAAGQPAAAARIGVSGEITRFWEETHATAGVGATWEVLAECAVVLHAYEAATGRRLWEKTYSQAVEGLANKALAQTVKAALNDPELIRQLSGRRD